MTNRCFIAINLPEEIKKELGFLIEKLKEKNNSREIKWVKLKGIHLTLHFLGYLDEQKIGKVKEIIQENVVGLSSLDIELKDLGGFPNLQKPKVLFISGQEKNEDKSLQKLQLKLGQELKKIGLEVDKRPWQIHFTLARLKNPARLLITKLNELPMKSFRAESVELMRSELSSQGARYTVLKSYHLR